MSADETYVRKLSRNEARDGFIFLSKDAVALFPPVDVAFQVAIGEEAVPACVRAIPCTCVGEPHEHYHLVFGERPGSLALTKGLVVSLEKGVDGSYLLDTRD
jgi:hypothetical protein